MIKIFKFIKLLFISSEEYKGHGMMRKIVFPNNIKKVFPWEFDCEHKILVGGEGRGRAFFAIKPKFLENIKEHTSY